MNTPADGPRLAKLAQLLASRTKAGTVPWEETDDAFLFLTITEAGTSIAIRQLPGPRPGSEQYVIRVRGASGALIEELASHDPVRAGLGEPPQYPEVRAMLAELWVVARNTALRVDEVIDTLLAEFGEG